MGSYDYLNKKTTIPEIEMPFNDLELYIPKKAYERIINYAKAAKDMEISGFADLKYEKETGQITVGEIYLLEQSVGGATVHMDEEAVSKFNMEMVKKGVKQLPQMWWHSHVDMAAFFSGTDQETSENLRNDTFSVSLVVNKRGDTHARMYINTQSVITTMGEKFTHEAWMSIDDLTIRVERTDEIPQEILDEVNEKIHQKKYKLPKWDKAKSTGKHWLGTGKKKEENTTNDTADDYDWQPEDEEGAIYDPETHKLKNVHEDNEDSQSEWKKEMREAYTLNPKVSVVRLPKNPQAADKIVRDLNLGIKYNSLSNEWTYVRKGVEDPQYIYVDWYEVLNWKDYDYANTSYGASGEED